MTRFILALLFLTSPSFATGQTEVTVKVIDEETKEPVKNVNAIILGTTKGTTSNGLGFFRLKLEPDQKFITISHVSYINHLIAAPAGVDAFTVPLRRAVFQFFLDLRNYPKKVETQRFSLKQTKPVILGSDTLVVVEALADFPGGLEGFKDYFGSNFDYPESELMKNQDGEIRLEFTIDKSGAYKDINCPDSEGEMCNEFRRILSVIPVWTPAEQRGEKLDQKMIFLISYGPNNFWRRKMKALKKSKK